MARSRGRELAEEVTEEVARRSQLREALEQSQAQEASLRATLKHVREGGAIEQQVAQHELSAGRRGESSRPDR